MDPQTKAAIAALLVEVRTWHPGLPAPASIPDLARRFALDVMIVKGILQSEGFFVDADGNKVDPRADTLPDIAMPPEDDSTQ